MHGSPAPAVTRDSHYGAPPSYCPHCQELFSSGDTSGATEAPCPSCASPVRLAIGRFAGIVSVVRFVVALNASRRAALLAALQPERLQTETTTTGEDVRWLTDWLATHDVTSSSFWRRCLVIAMQVTPVTTEALPEARLLAAARDVAQQAGASQSFTPRRY